MLFLYAGKHYVGQKKKGKAKEKNIYLWADFKLKAYSLTSLI